MAEINAAYDLVRAAAQHEAAAAGASDSAAGARGDWLIPRAAAGARPGAAATTLNRGEDVRLVTPTSTWASRARSWRVTDRRLLWLLDDAPVSRVHSLAFRNVAKPSSTASSASTRR